jgi:hypothetical protein
MCCVKVVPDLAGTWGGPREIQQERYAETLTITYEAAIFQTDIHGAGVRNPQPAQRISPAGHRDQHVARPTDPVPGCLLRGRRVAGARVGRRDAHVHDVACPPAHPVSPLSRHGTAPVFDHDYCVYDRPQGGQPHAAPMRAIRLPSSFAMRARCAGATSVANGSTAGSRWSVTCRRPPASSRTINLN